MKPKPNPVWHQQSSLPTELALVQGHETKCHDAEKDPQNEIFLQEKRYLKSEKIRENH